MVFPIQIRKREHHLWTLQIQISLGTKFQLKITRLIFWTKFSQKERFRSKIEKVSTTIELCIFGLV